MPDTPENSPNFKTLKEAFDEGTYFNSAMGCKARDWYVVCRRVIPQPYRYVPDVVHPCTYLIACLDAATAANLLFEPILKIEATAAILADALTRVLQTHGLPRKGIVIHPLVWARYSALKQSSLAKEINFDDYDQMGVDFGETPLADRVRIENWIKSNGLACSFTLDATSGGALVDAQASALVT